VTATSATYDKQININISVNFNELSNQIDLSWVTKSSYFSMKWHALLNSEVELLEIVAHLSLTQSI